MKINKDLSQDIENRDVIIVEDILDSGITLSYLTKYLQNRKPSSICIATLLDKPARRRADVQAKYVGFTVPDAFVVGYGLDYAEKYRNLPFIGSSRKYTKNKSLIYILSAPSGGTAEKEVTVFEQPTLPQQDPSDRLSRIDLRAAARHDLFHDEKHREGIAHLFGSHRAF